MRSKSYHELIQYSTFIERAEYLCLHGTVTERTFGADRYLNQAFYQSREWRHTRSGIILRDEGCDLGVHGHEIFGRDLLVHHINPVTLEDIEYGADCIFDPDNLITTRSPTHNAIHYGNVSSLPKLPVERVANDTTLWVPGVRSKHGR